MSIRRKLCNWWRFKTIPMLLNFMGTISQKPSTAPISWASSLSTWSRRQILNTFIENARKLMCSGLRPSSSPCTAAWLQLAHSCSRRASAIEILSQLIFSSFPTTSSSSLISGKAKTTFMIPMTKIVRPSQWRQSEELHNISLQSSGKLTSSMEVLDSLNITFINLMSLVQVWFWSNLPWWTKLQASTQKHLKLMEKSSSVTTWRFSKSFILLHSASFLEFCSGLKNQRGLHFAKYSLSS